MSRLDRALIAAIWEGHLKFDESPTFSPRFATIGDLRLVRVMHGGWQLIVGDKIHSIPIGRITQLYLELCRKNHNPPTPPEATP